MSKRNITLLDFFRGDASSADHYTQLVMSGELLSAKVERGGARLCLLDKDKHVSWVSRPPTAEIKAHNDAIDQKNAAKREKRLERRGRRGHNHAKANATT